MSTGSTYAPGTLFRIYTADNSKHFTAVVLKNGQILEVKNPYTNKKELFPSFNMWRTFHGAAECEVIIDVSKSYGIIQGSDTNDIKYPTEKHSAYTWVKWLYLIISEAAPQLLKSDEFKTFYNQMVEICTKHKQELRHYDHKFKPKTRYDSKNLKGSYHTNSKWLGYPAYFVNENSYNYSYSEAEYKQYSNNDYDTARIEIIYIYKKIYNIVEPYITDYMSKKNNILMTQSKIVKSKATIKRLMNKIKKLENTIECYDSNILQEVENLSKYETELITFQDAVL